MEFDYHLAHAYSKLLVIYMQAFSLVSLTLGCLPIQTWSDLSHYTDFEACKAFNLSYPNTWAFSLSYHCRIRS